MPRPRPLIRLPKYAVAIMAGPSGIAFLPAICLAAFWFGGEGALIVLCSIVPLAYFLVRGTDPEPVSAYSMVDGVLNRPALEREAEKRFQKAANTGQQSVACLVAIDEFEALKTRYGHTAAQTVVKRIGERVVAALRANDLTGLMGEAQFGVCLNPVRRLDLESCLQMIGRIQTSIEEPISIDGMTVYVSASIGFCPSLRAPGDSGADWLNGAAIALHEAQMRGPSTIRAFSDQMHRDTQSRSDLREEIETALDDGQIVPWFQPQISTDTGQITGFEALARWQHPTRGMIPPAEFLPVIEDAHLLERLAEVMMYHAFTALKDWDEHGLAVPQVGVNFAGSELSNPRLPEKIQWELDRFDLTADRLAVEVLETVVSSTPDDIITRNIRRLGKIGCRIDLDDFGTGNASIASIRRLTVGRIKIDRSFVMKADRDPEQQRMIAAILTMAERLGIETLAEGVETAGEHALLSQLGCSHVQGFGIARPMPFDMTLDWIRCHTGKLTDVPRIMGGQAT